MYRYCCEVADTKIAEAVVWTWRELACWGAQKPGEGSITNHVPRFCLSSFVFIARVVACCMGI